MRKIRKILNILKCGTNKSIKLRIFDEYCFYCDEWLNISVNIFSDEKLIKENAFKYKKYEIPICINHIVNMNGKFFKSTYYNT